MFHGALGALKLLRDLANRFLLCKSHHDNAPLIGWQTLDHSKQPRAPIDLIEPRLGRFFHDWTGIVAIACLPLGLFAYKFALKDYQRQRIQTFVDPSQDPRGAGYQTIQARVTVGSGGLTGKGFRRGTQGQYKFLPVAHNDFIFSVLAEEQGFIGVLTALGLYLFVILRSLEAARLAKDRLGAYLVGGIITGFAFQVIYNVTMSAGLAPVKGITLPLMSYGGSSLIASLACFGLILNVRMRRFTN